MKIGYQTVIWGRRIEDLELVLAQLSALGFEGIEFAQAPSELYVRDKGSPDSVRPVRDIQELLHLVRAHGLELLSFAGGTLEERMAFCDDYRPPYLYVDSWDAAAEAALKANPPFTLAIHPHAFMPIRFLEHAEKFLNAFDTPKLRNYVKFLPDTAHLTVAEADIADAIRRYKNRLAAVHFKDWRPSFGRYSHRYARGFVPLGEGIVAWGKASRLEDEGIIDVLQEIGYDGWIVAELDSSPGPIFDCVVASAEWLANKSLMEFPDLGKLDKNLVLSRLAKPATICPPEIELKFLQILNEAAGRGIPAFYNSVITAFAQTIPAHLVKLWITRPEESYMFLVSARGLPGVEQLDHLEMSGGCMGEFARENRPKAFDLAKPENAKRFEDQTLLASLTAVGATRMLSIPILNPANAHHLRYIVNIFPKAEAPEVGLDTLFRLGQHVASFADFFLDELCAETAGMTSYLCTQSQTRSELMGNLQRHLLKVFNCEGAQIFLVNDGRDRLEAACPGVTDWTVPVGKQFYRKGEGLTGKAWQERDMLFSSATNTDSRANNISCEKKLSPGRREGVFATIAKRRDEVLGVIRLTNKRDMLDPVCSTMFNDDDAAVLDAIIQAAVPRLELLRTNERQLKALGRMTHEFQGPIVAIRGAVQLMQRRIKVNSWSAQKMFGQDYLSDIWNWTDLLITQVEAADIFRRSREGITPNFSPTLLLKDVIAPAIHQVHLLLQERDYAQDRIRHGNFTDIPPLLIDRGQFRQVIFNLLSNAIKYSQDRATFRVEIESGKIGSDYIIWFSDYGIGINPELKEAVFEPGFRAPEAARKDVNNQGLGLSVVQAILQAHGGRIKLTGFNKPTRFTIHLPETLERNPPKGAIVSKNL